MKERPILFNSDMVRAILAGRKTQTRRPWTPSIHMPRILSRITLEITDIRVERLRIMTSDDAIAEGAYEVSRVGDGPASATWTMGASQEWRYDSPLQAFEAMWNSIYAKRGFGWDVNPWVWVIIFKRVEKVCPKN